MYFKECVVAFLVGVVLNSKCAQLAGGLDATDGIVIANAFVVDDQLGFRTLVGYIQLKGEEAVKKYLVSTPDLQGMVVSSGTYSWEAVKKSLKPFEGGVDENSIAAAKKQAEEDAKKQIEAAEKKAKDAIDQAQKEVEKKVAEALKVNKEFQDKWEKAKKGGDAAERDLLRQVLSEGAGKESVKKYAASDKKASVDKEWPTAVGEALKKFGI